MEQIQHLRPVHSLSNSRQQKQKHPTTFYLSGQELSAKTLWLGVTTQGSLPTALDEIAPYNNRKLYLVVKMKPIPTLARQFHYEGPDLQLYFYPENKGNKQEGIKT